MYSSIINKINKTTDKTEKTIEELMQILIELEKTEQKILLYQNSKTKLNIKTI